MRRVRGIRRLVGIRLEGRESLRELVGIGIGVYSRHAESRVERGQIHRYNLPIYLSTRLPIQLTS